MAERVVDTNVLLVASGRDDSSPECRLSCIGILVEITSRGGLVLDSLGLIVEEYSRRHNYSGQPGVGDAFFRWVHSNRYRKELCSTVPITPTEDGSFAEFPADPGLATFDEDDRKFVATAISHGDAEITVGTDSDWWQHREAFAEAGVKIQFRCEGHFRSRDAAGRR